MIKKRGGAVEECRQTLVTRMVAWRGEEDTRVNEGVLVRGGASMECRHL